MTARLILNSIEQFSLYLTHVHISKIETYILFELIGGIFPNITLLELILTKTIKTIKLLKAKRQFVILSLKKVILRYHERLNIYCLCFNKKIYAFTISVELCSQ